MVFINVSFLNIRNKPFPYPRAVPSHIEEVSLWIPTVEVPYNRNALGIRSPNGEVRPLHSINSHGIRAELVIYLKMAPLFKKVYVMVCNNAHVMHPLSFRHN